MKTKNGFSLAELLLCLGIIAIVSAMGFSISQQSMERAHNLYWYTGYSALNDVLGDVTYRGYSVAAPATFISEVAKTFDIDTTNSEKYSVSSNTYRLIAKNGIQFSFNNVDVSSADTTSSSFFVDITMTIPAIKKKKSGLLNTTNLRYYPNLNGGMLVPVESSGSMNLQTRKDLLPAYIDTGDREQKKTYMSYRDAYCKVIGSSITKKEKVLKKPEHETAPITGFATSVPGANIAGGNSSASEDANLKKPEYEEVDVSILDCTGVSGLGQSQGTVNVANPQKVF